MTRTQVTGLQGWNLLITLSDTEKTAAALLKYKRWLWVVISNKHDREYPSLPANGLGDF